MKICVNLTAYIYNVVEEWYFFGTNGSQYMVYHTITQYDMFLKWVGIG